MLKSQQFERRRLIERAVLYFTTAIVLLLMVFPAYWLITNAFKVPIDTAASPPVLFPRRITLDNFKLVLQSAGMARFFFNSIFIALASTAAAIFIGSMAAYSLAQSYLSFAIRRGLMMWILVTRIFPPITTAIPYFVLLRALKLTDTHIAIIITYTAYALPFVIWLMLGFFQELPKDIDRAAIIDGCSLWQRFSDVILPLALPGIAVTAIFTFIYSWNEFLYASILTSRNAKTLPVVISGYMSDRFLRWGEMSALATLMLIPVLIFAALTQRYLVRGLTFGAVKE